MYLSLKWLQKYLPDLDVTDLEQLKTKLDTRLSEVDSIETKGSSLKNLVIAQILEVEPHPSNPKLTVCRVDIGKEVHSTIVCGAPNARAGIKTVACLPGGQVVSPEGIMQIKERKMGEVVSQGMLCAPDELGMSDDHTKIIEVSKSETVGREVTHLFQDAVIEIENKALPHRPDAFSHLGIAREIGAILELGLNHSPQLDPISPESDKDILPLTIEIKDTDHCKRFSAVVMDNVVIEPSPLWLQVLLSYTGVRPINNVVDVTNYVMLGMGQPLHAFDYDKLDEPKLIARQAKKGEKLATLDGKQRELSEEMVVVASTNGPESVAGIMGGAETEISSSTTRIVVEAANWEMYQIRRTSRELGLRSEASTRFEKGISPSTTVAAINSSISLISDLCGAEAASQILDQYPEPEQKLEVEFDLNSVKRLSGIEIEKSRILQLLTAIGIEVVGSEKITADQIHRPGITSEVTLRIPEHRRDLKIKQDIVEEIVRLYGYENFPLTLPARDLRPPKTSKHMIISRQVKEALSSNGATEVFTYSMVGDELYSKAQLESSKLHKIPQPISPELNMVRDSILPSIISKVKQNLEKYDQVSLYELSRVATAKRVDGLPAQPFKLAVVSTGTDDTDAFRNLKRFLETVTQITTNGELFTEQHNSGNIYHPGKSGVILLDGVKIGEIGVVHPLVRENFGVRESLAAFELNFSDLCEFELALANSSPVSNYQSVKRDINYWTGSESQIGEHIRQVQQTISEVYQVTLVDTYAKDDKTSITLRYVIQSYTQTLEQEQINQIMQNIVEVAKQSGLKLRE